MKLSVMAVMAMVVMSCAAMQSKTIEPWHIELSSSGGLAGKGAGRFVFDSEGKLEVTTTTGRSCTFTLTDGERQHFTELLTKAKPEKWATSYSPKNQGADRFGYMMKVETPGESRQVSWIDDPLPMPADLEALVDAIITGPESVRVRYGAQCR